MAANQKVFIELDHVSKSYNKKKIFQSVSFGIHASECILIKGGNGCGKSTLLKLIAGLLTYDEGNIYKAEDIRLQYVPERFPKLSMTAYEYVSLMAKIEGCPIELIENRCKELYHDFFFEDLILESMNNLSKGSLQKVAIIQALITKPDVLIMDEPFSGEDDASKEVLISKIKQLKKEGCGIIFTTHEQSFINQVVDTAYCFRDGVLLPYQKDMMLCHAVFEGDMRKLPKSLSSKLYTIDDNNIIFNIEKEQCNEVILEMLRHGFFLKEYDYDEISVDL